MQRLMCINSGVRLTIACRSELLASLHLLAPCQTYHVDIANTVCNIRRAWRGLNFARCRGNNNFNDLIFQPCHGPYKSMHC